MCIQHIRCIMGPFPDTLNCGLRMNRECRERFPRHRLQKNPLVSDPSMRQGTCKKYVPWCMPGSLIRGAGKTHFRRMRNTQFYVSGKRPMHTGLVCFVLLWSYYANHWENIGIVCTTSLNVFLKIQQRSGRNYWYHPFFQPIICGLPNKFLTLPGEHIFHRDIIINQLLGQVRFLWKSGKFSVKVWRP